MAFPITSARVCRPLCNTTPRPESGLVCLLCAACVLAIHMERDVCRPFTAVVRHTAFFRALTSALSVGVWGSNIGFWGFHVGFSGVT